MTATLFSSFIFSTMKRPGDLINATALNNASTISASATANISHPDWEIPRSRIESQPFQQ